MDDVHHHRFAVVLVLRPAGPLPSASRQGGLGGRLLQFGIIVVSLIEWSVLIIASGMRHFVIHLMQRANLGDDASLTPEQFEAAALAVHSDIRKELSEYGSSG